MQEERIYKVVGINFPIIFAQKVASLKTKYYLCRVIKNK